MYFIFDIYSNFDKRNIVRKSFLTSVSRHMADLQSSVILELLWTWVSSVHVCVYLPNLESIIKPLIWMMLYWRVFSQIVEDVITFSGIKYFITCDGTTYLLSLNTNTENFFLINLSIWVVGIAFLIFIWSSS